MKNYLHEGNKCAFVAPSGGVVSGTPLIINGLFVIPSTTAAEDEEFTGRLTGVFKLPKAAEDQDIGEILYWHPVNGNLQLTGAATTYKVGAVVNADVLAADDYVECRLDGITTVVIT
jgi:predicted RecA/RadA family phage recombinase